MILLASFAWSAEPELVPLEDLLDLMDDDMDRPTDVADRVARSAREASVPVSVLTGEQLRLLGARDLVDALRLLPSVEFGGDTWNTDGMLLRGNHGSDGRVLVLVDGHEWNEDLYGYYSLANRLPVEAIDRIEVIRGPGSAVYGGYAMMGVVRVTTRSATEEGGAVAVRSSLLGTGVYGRQDVTATAGHAWRDGTRVGVTAVLGRGRRSDDLYQDAYGGEVDLTDVSEVSPSFVSAQLHAGRLEASVAAEQYRVSFRDGSARIVPLEHENLFSGIYGRASWTQPVSDRTDLQVGLQSKWQEPWRSTSWPVGNYNYFRNHTQRHVATTTLLTRPADAWVLQAGAAGGLLIHDPAPEDTLTVPASRYAYGALWGEGAVETAPADVTLGLRCDGNEAFGAALSPRLAVGQAWRRVHYKAAVNRAFRAPSVIQAASPDIDAETTTAVDLELGVGPSAWSYLTVNAFRNWVIGPMVYRYSYDPVSGEESEGYFNGTGLGTMGLEAMADVRAGNFTIGGGWAGVRAEDVQEDWAVPEAPSRVLSAPAHKIVGRGTWDDGGRFDAGAVVTWVGDRWGIADVQAGAPIYTLLPSALLLDLSVEVRHLVFRGVSLQATAHDLLDQNPPQPQTYYAGKAPLPQTGRELLLQLAVER